jgi:tRNA-Thr(GGU) m(6)t(6)A37 methyltransferase TsaA
MSDDARRAITFRPIGEVRTPYAQDWAPEQPIERPAEPGRFRVVVDREYAAGLAGLERFRYVTLVTALDRNAGPVALEVAPPWAEGRTAGVFATRAAQRPNPIGLHVVRLLKVEGNVLHTWPIDVYDGTPLLDVKPYLRGLDSKADADIGWLADLDGADHVLEHLRGLPHDHDHAHDRGHHDGEHGHDHDDE